ncbi:MAG: hypothetical protein JWP81_2078 [Ferruginibacter sp.]|nr:hypothetical protein [Ferruginibacter sp.]
MQIPTLKRNSKLNASRIPLGGQGGLICIIILTCLTLSSKAQISKSTESVQQLWFGYFNQTRLTDKWGLWTDLHLRTREDFTNKFSQSIVRLGLTYYVNDATKLTAGYAYVSIYPADAHKKITQPEHRPWQQIQWHTKYGKKRMMQWFRLEERYRRKIINDSTLGKGNNFNYRVRYNIWYDIPFSKAGIVPNGLSFVVNDEVHINFGKEIINNYFDQNRFFAGLKYQTGEQANLQLGYMNLFQQLPAGNKYRSLHTIRLFYFQNLDVRRNSNQKKS